MSPEKRNNHYQRVAGNTRAAAAGAPPRAVARRGARQVHAVPAEGARPVPRVAGPMLRPPGDHEIPSGKGILSAVEAHQPCQPLPIWLAVLLATRCQATRDGENHVVRWNCSSGRALYTNTGAHTEQIEPLGVTLKGGLTLAVCWVPGETTYSLEVFRHYDQCA